jgi:hypothetical protein
MAILNRKLKFLFLGIPKTGCTSMCKHLLDKYEGSIGAPEEEVLSEEWPSGQKHSTLGEILRNKVLTEEDLKTINIFCYTRNPWDYSASHFSFLKGITNTFRKSHGKAAEPSERRGELWRLMYSNPCYSFFDYVDFHRDKEGLRVIGKWMVNPHEDLVTVLRYENYESDLKEFFSSIGVEYKGGIERLNVSPVRGGAHYKDFFLKDDMKDVIAKAYAEDIKRYGYEF